jgi:TetR/AcrR family transcriptional regulator
MRKPLKKKRFESDQRALILDAAVRIFAEKGYKGATIRILGRTAKVNSALIYYYYENKHNLFTESIRMILRGFLDCFHERRRNFANARDRLTCLVDTVFDYYTGHPERMRLMAVALSLHSNLFAEALNVFVKDKALAPLEILQEGINKGELKRTHPIQAWWGIIGLCMFSLLSQGVIPQLASKRTAMPPFDASNRKAQIVDLLMNGITSSSNTRTRITRSEMR